MRTLTITSLLLATIASGCTAVLDAPSRWCSKNADCSTLAGEPRRLCIEGRCASFETVAWGCVFTPDPLGDNRVNLVAQLSNPADLPNSANLVACRFDDPTCQDPFATQRLAPGSFAFQVNIPGRERTILMVQDPPDLALSLQVGPFDESREAASAMLVAECLDLRTLFTGVPPADCSGKAHLIAQYQGCRGEVAGIKFELDFDGDFAGPFYADPGANNASRSATATSEIGKAYFLNLDLAERVHARATLRATHVASGQAVGEVSVVLLPGTLTQAVIRPTANTPSELLRR